MFVRYWGIEEQWQMGKECGGHESEGNFEEILDWKTGGKEFFQKACVNMGG